MQIRVTNVRDENKDTIVVSFESTLGNASAHWIGSRPSEGTDYGVECEVPGVLTWGKEIIETTNALDSIFEKDGSICIVGQVELIEDDGIVSLMVGDDIILVETVNAPQVAPQCVRICVPYIECYDTNS